ncbi:MAG: type III PLP-dependent enzyme [Candidatus Sericytochromatia bacterium]
MPPQKNTSILITKRLKYLQKRLRLIPAHYFGNSFYLFDEAALADAVASFEKNLKGVTPFYAMKANDRDEILTYLAQAGWSFDAASAAEVEKLIALGVSGDRIILANPFKDRRTLETMVEHRVAMTTADSPEELVKLQQVYQDLAPEEQPLVLIRISLPAEGVQTDLGVKFGCPPIQALQLLKNCLKLGLKPGGISFHVGTQSWNLGNYERCLEASLWVLKEFERETGIDLRLIDIGGGFPWGSADGSGPLAVEPLLAEIGQLTAQAQAEGYVLQAQPGRVICAGAFTLVSTVIGKTHRNQRVWYYLSDGVYGAYNGILYDHQPYLFLPLGRSLEETAAWDDAVVCGPTCDGVDIMSQGSPLPVDLELGDALFTPDIGAYSMVAASQFNGFDRARIVPVSSLPELSHDLLPFQADPEAALLVS